MRITAVRPFPLWIGARNQLLVKVETDEGIFGWGESGLSGREQAVIGALSHFERILVGRDPMAIGALWQELYRSQYFEGGRVLQAAISAIDIALHDLKGKALGVPVYELLGGRHRDTVPTFASATARDVETALAQAYGLKTQGWDCIRLFPIDRGTDVFEPRESIAATAELCIRAREALGPGVVLGIDWHHRLSVAEATSFCAKLPAGTLDFLEEPIRAETPEAYEALRRMTSIPFAVGEEFASKWQFLPYIERDIHQFNRVDVCTVGGLTEAMKVAGWSEAHYVDLMPHDPLGPICTAASIHLAAAVTNFAWLEVRVGEAADYLAEDDPEMFTRRPTLEGTSYPVDDTPGLGIEIDETHIDDGDFRFWEAPHWKRRDGSVTNW